MATNTSNATTNQRVFRFAQKKQEWQGLNRTICLPYFNVDHFPAVYGRWMALSEFLRQEANALWDLGVNVYN